jgi:hypothetical protein
MQEGGNISAGLKAVKKNRITTLQLLHMQPADGGGRVPFGRSVSLNVGRNGS